MNSRPYVHVVDSDVSRRAKISHDIRVKGLHAEIYQDLDELITCSPRCGTALFAIEETADPERVIAAIKSLPHSLPVAFFSANPSSRQIVKCMLAGGQDYLEWPFSPEALRMSVARLQKQAERDVESDNRRAEAHRGVDALTCRQRQVLDGLIVGDANKDIAKRLRISPRTVEIHRARMMACLSARSVADAVRIGLNAGLQA